MDHIKVRRATHHDAVALGRMQHDFGTEFDTPGDPADVLGVRFDRILREEGVFAVIAEDEGEPVGFGLVTLRPAIWFDGPVAQLEEFYVIPDLRDQGIGTRLLTLIRRIATEAGSPEMHINVDEIDADTRRFYERYGFVNIEPGADYRMLFYVGPTQWTRQADSA
ncbi:GNAT family N-acetyltransferase [Granulicoccus phenolivorans]|uniref:GNAT family N-acetyltransferase n=1 Tax=Granulicoccus phenolivorans TaxID=266854 RepID=UPI00041FA469|nr:GNAT family N-acetyltransferase [Granulicoccus phenolivorans]